MNPISWGLWALFLIAQNFSFTFVSRARNSGSLRKHLVASIFSNGIWFVGQIFAVGVFLSILSGKYGTNAAVGAGLFYTTFTITGSLLAHQWALKTEKNEGRVGGHKDLATFTKIEGEVLRNRVLLVDTGDGLGTFTVDEIAQLKELLGTKLEQVTTQVTDELINYSGPEGIRTVTRDADALVPNELYTSDELEGDFERYTQSHDIPAQEVKRTIALSKDVVA